MFQTKITNLFKKRSQSITKFRHSQTQLKDAVCGFCSNFPAIMSAFDLLTDQYNNFYFARILKDHDHLLEMACTVYANSSKQFPPENTWNI